MGILSWLILLPFLTALGTACLADPKKIRWVALLGTGAHLLLTGVALQRYWSLIPQASSSAATAATRSFAPDLQLVEKLPWFESQGIQYFLGADGISMLMVLLTSIVIFAGVLASWNVEHRAREYFTFLLVLVTGVFGVFLSFDLFLFFMFYEVAVLPMYLLIGIWGTGPKEYAAMKLTLMLMVGSAFILVGFLALYYGSGLHTFDFTRLATVNFPLGFQIWVFPTIFVGFGILGALYPFHTWSPDGHASAPTAVSMLHAGVLMKLGGYGALRMAVFLLPEGAKKWGLFFMCLATINILYGAFGAIKQKDLKFFVAYSSVSHCGMVLFGVVSLNLLGIKGAVYQMFSHGIMTSLFFALIGMVYGRTHTRMIPEMSGLAKTMPWLATCFYIAGFASLGLPGLAGFVAESHIFLGGMFGNPWANAAVTRTLTVLATMSIVVTAVYVLRGLGSVFLGPNREASTETLTDANLIETLCTGILLAVLVAFGVFPSLANHLIEGSLTPILNRLQAAGTFVTTGN